MQIQAHDGTKYSMSTRRWPSSILLKAHSNTSQMLFAYGATGVQRLEFVSIHYISSVDSADKSGISNHWYGTSSFNVATFTAVLATSKLRGEHFIDNQSGLQQKYFSIHCNTFSMTQKTLHSLALYSLLHIPVCKTWRKHFGRVKRWMHGG